MTSTPIEPGSVLGLLGAGQLGAMFAGAASRLGFRVAVWDPDPDAPAHRIATSSFAHPFTDQETLARFSGLVQVVTYEWENVPADLCQRLEERVPVRPASTILRIIQDRVAQKTFLADQGFPVPRFEALHSPDQLRHIAQRLGYPVVCKTATAGYDGKGQWTIGSEADLLAVEAALHSTAQPGSTWIVESYVPFERELSMVVARGIDGATVVYPLAENTHEAGILRISLVPAAVPAAVAKQAEELARNMVDRLQGVGVFCLELFQNAGESLLINEVAPRPHNSGHYTLDACNLSQFEQQVRAICGMPLGKVRLLSPAAMVNLIGDDATTIEAGSGCRVLLKNPDSRVHMYGKRTIRPGRKMGHVTFLADRLQTAQDQAARFRQCLIDERVR